MTIKIFAPAKVNLSLHVTGQRSDGYHLLDSLVVFVDVGDQITAETADKSTLHVTGPFAENIPTDGANLMIQAAERAGVPMAMTLDKHLPPASGIGGGSADAAATLKAAARLGGVAMSNEVALSLGADVPVCMRGRPVRMRGIGEDITEVELPAVHMVLVNPRIEVSTPSVFAALNSKTNMAMPDKLPKWPDALALIDWLSTQRNDLQRPAVDQVPELAAVLTALALTPGALLPRMSGSGATCFALFEDRDAADHAAAQLAESNPWWWVKSASTLPAFV